MVSIKAEKREIQGKNTRHLREKGKIPAVIYGAGKENVLLELELKDFERVFRQAGESSLVELEIGSDKRNVLIHEVARDPIKDKPLHIDFLEVRMDKPIKAEVALEYIGESPAVKNFGGILVKVAHKIEIEALPKDLPHEIKVDISKLVNLEDKLTVRDLKLPSGVKALTELEEIIVIVEAPRTEEELKAEEETAPALALDQIEVTGGKKKEKEGEIEEGTEPEKPVKSEKPEKKEKKS